MKVLGIESSCDETAAAVVEGGERVLSSVVQTQVDRHRIFGGVVPEIACRIHIEAIVPVVDEALRRAGVGLDDVDGIAVTTCPGLVGALLVGVSFAKSLALATGKPLVGVDHIQAHAYAVKMAHPALEFPCVSLVVSGGHTVLFRTEGARAHHLLGTTLDDAAGEAFDKGAKVLGLGFPGGPAVERAAEGHESGAVRFPRTYGPADSLDFSFSGLKTALLYRVRGQDARADRLPEAGEVGSLAWGYQEAIVGALAERAFRACRREGIPRLGVGGGVAANGRLRAILAERGAEEGVEVRIAPMSLCTDNAAMIAGVGTRALEAGERAGLDLDAIPTKDYRAR